MMKHSKMKIAMTYQVLSLNPFQILVLATQIGNPGKSAIRNMMSALFTSAFIKPDHSIHKIMRVKKVLQ